MDEDWQGSSDEPQYSAIQNDLLMETIRKYPAIYDKNSLDYRKSKKAADAWNDIEILLNIAPGSAPRRYNTIRTALSKYLKRFYPATEVPLPPRFQNLGWLVEHISHRNNDGGISGVGRNNSDDSHDGETSIFDQQISLVDNIDYDMDQPDLKPPPMMQAPSLDNEAGTFDVETLPQQRSMTSRRDFSETNRPSYHNGQSTPLTTQPLSQQPPPHTQRPYSYQQCQSATKSSTSGPVLVQSHEFRGVSMGSSGAIGHIVDYSDPDVLFCLSLVSKFKKLDEESGKKTEAQIKVLEAIRDTEMSS